MVIKLKGGKSSDPLELETAGYFFSSTGQTVRWHKTHAVIQSYRICPYKNVTKNFELDLFKDYLDTIICLLVLYVLFF